MIKKKELTIYDIARELNISPATVSRALKNNPAISSETRALIQNLAKKQGYRPNTFARNLRNRKTNTIGVIIPRLDSFFMSTVLAGMESVVNPAGYHLLINQSNENIQNERANAETLFNNRVDALIVSLAADTTDISHFDSFFSKNVPVFFFDRVCENKQCRKYVIDNYKGGYLIAKHLIGENCKRIVHITGNLTKNVYSDRLNGYKKALEESNLEYNPEYVFSCNLSLQAGIDLVSDILSLNPRPDAIFVANDTCAAGCIIELKKRNIKVPEDIAVAGFNNDPVAIIVEPNLTTIDYPGHEMGKAVATDLINYLTGVVKENLPEKVIIDSGIIIRESTKKHKR
jgi:LacI family transcriptional regulator